MAKKGQKYLNYTNDERIEIVNLYNSKKYSSAQLSQMYGGISPNTIRMWAFQFNKGNNFNSKRGRKKESEIDYKKRYEILKKYRAFLKKEQEKK